MKRLGVPMEAQARAKGGKEPMQFHIAGRSDVGRVRRSNQDRIHIDSKERFFLLADGVSGAQGGDLAAQLAVEHVREQLEDHLNGFRHRWWGSSDFELMELLSGSLEEANALIGARAQHLKDFSNMACTMVACVFHRDRCLCACVGDSRLYRVHGNLFEQVSRDQTLATQMVDQGYLQLNDPRLVQYGHVLTDVLGGRQNEPPQIQRYRLRLQKGDCVLACSDGLSGELDDNAICTLLDLGQPVERLVDSLVAAANRAGGRDNVSVILSVPEGASANRLQPESRSVGEVG